MFWNFSYQNNGRIRFHVHNWFSPLIESLQKVPENRIAGLKTMHIFKDFDSYIKIAF